MMNLLRTSAVLALVAALVVAQCPGDGSTLPDGSSDHGIIGSDSDYNGPGLYATSSSCSWTLDCSAFADTYVHIDFVSGDIEDGFDFLNVGSSTFSGVFNEADLLLGQPTTVSVTFTSDDHNEFSGFLLQYSCAPVTTNQIPGTCQYNAQALYTDATNTISVPAYDPNQVCDWYVQCPSGSEFTLDTLTGETESGYDVIRLTSIYGEVEYSGVLSLNNQRYSYSPSGMFIRFISDYSTTFSGFDLKYRCTRCSSSTDGGFFTNLTGTIMTDVDGAGPIQYDTNEHCEWLIYCPANYRVRLTDVTGESEAGYDWLYSLSLDYSTQYTSFSGATADTNVYFGNGTQSTILQFVSDESVTFNGFTIDYTCMDNSYCCQSTTDYCNAMDVACAQLDCTVVVGLAASDSFFQPLATACTAAHTECAIVAAACHQYDAGCPVCGGGFCPF